MTPTILIVGAGIFGLTAAVELRQRGYSVTVLDSKGPPHPDASSTDVSKAVRLDYGDDLFYTELAEAALIGWDRWNRDLAEPLFHRDGWLLLTQTMVKGGFEYESRALLNQRGHTLQPIDSTVLAKRFPAWTQSPYSTGYYNPQDGWVESSAVVRAIADKAINLGVTILTEHTVRKLCLTDNRVTGVELARGNRLAADQVVVAAGAWTPLLLPWLADRMWPTAQTVLHFKPADPSPYQAAVFPPWAADIANTGWYGFPATGDDEVKIGRHVTGRSMSPDEPRLVAEGEEARFRAFLHNTLPDLAEAPLSTSRLCFYCDTFDGDFWIDRDPNHPGLTVAAGGSGHGFKFAPLLGAMIADAVESNSNPFLPRFAWREAGQGRHEGARAED